MRIIKKTSKGEQKIRVEKKLNSKLVDFNPVTLIITLNINGPSATMKIVTSALKNELYGIIKKL